MENIIKLKIRIQTVIYYSALKLLKKKFPFKTLVVSIMLSMSERRYKLFKIKNIDHDEELVKSHIGYSVNTTEENAKNELVKIKVNALGVRLFKKAIVFSKSSLIVKGKTAHYQSVSSVNLASKTDLRAKLIVANTTSHIVVEWVNPIAIKGGLLLTGYWPLNWYHWTIEILSRYETFKMSSYYDSEISLLIPGSIKHQTNHMKFLKYLFPTSQVTYLNEDMLYQPEKLIWADSLFVSVPNTYYPNQKYLPSDFTVYWEQAKSYLNQVNGLNRNIHSRDRRIFLARQQKERRYNQAEIAKMLLQYSFEEVYLEEMTLEEQAKIMSESEVIVGPTGAAWANLIFCLPNTKALLWAPELVRGASIYANLAYLREVKLVHYFYKTDYQDWRHYKKSSSQSDIDINNLELSIQKLLNND